MSKALIDVIVPTVEGREDDLKRCCDSYLRQSSVRVRLIITRNSETAGWGWIEGLKKSDAKYVHLCADDIEVTSPTWAEACIEAAHEGYIAAPFVYRPDGSLESCGGDMALPNCLHQIEQADYARVGFSPLPFLTREAMDAIRMLPVHYSSDVFLSHRGRQLGFESVVRHGYEVTHHHSMVKRGAGMSQNDRAAHDWQIVQKALAEC